MKSSGSKVICVATMKNMFSLLVFTLPPSWGSSPEKNCVSSSGGGGGGGELIFGSWSPETNSNGGGDRFIGESLIRGWHFIPERQLFVLLIK